MDNNELDKILKDKLKNTIKPSQEFENKMLEKINEQKNSNFKKVQYQPKKKSYKQFTRIISFAAIFVLVFTFGVLYRGKNGEPIIPGINNSSNEIVTIKAIKPTKLESGVVARDSEFLITVEENNSTVESVQRSLFVEPALEYSISKNGNNEYKLKFKQNIPDNVILKLQYVKNKIVEDSWAYQTNTDLSVTKSYPSDGSIWVEKTSVIEVELSYADVVNLEKNVSIEPKTEGKWEHIGKVWRFIPSKQLENGKKYKVTVNKEITANGKNMKEDYKFDFTVGDNNIRCDYMPLSVDNINNFSDNEKVRIFYNSWGEEPTKIGKVEIRKFANSNEFIDYLQNENYTKSTEYGNVEFEEITSDNVKSIILKRNLPVGYYAAIIKDSKGVELFNSPLQINNMQCYALETERDIVVWTAKDGKLAEGVQINYLDKIAKTNNKGIAKLENVTDGSQKMKYAKIGNDSNVLVVGLNNFTHENYPESFIYTDRPLYKNTDTVNVWGFVPRNLFFDKIDENEFYIKIEENKYKISVDNEGSFNYKFDLKNYKADSIDILLLYKDKQIGFKEISVENYELPNYEYEIIASKNYAYDGEKFEFDVKVKHITGFPVVGKLVVIDYDGKKMRERTDDKGIVHMVITAKGDNTIKTTGLKTMTINVYNGDLEEYTNSLETMNFHVLTRDVYTNIIYPQGASGNLYNVELYKLLKNKNERIENIDEIYDGPYNTKVDIYIEETKYTRYITGYKYNEYNKQNEPIYDSKKTVSKEKYNTITSTNGKFAVDQSKIKMKKSTDNEWYDYVAIINYKDMSGRLVEETIYLSNPNVEEIKSGHWDESDYYNKRYCFYRYFFEDENYGAYNTKAKYGDIIDLKLKESTSSGEKEIKNQGKVLRIAFKQNIRKMDIIENDEFSYKFTEEDGSGTKITGAYFVNGKFYRMPAQYYDLDEESRKIDIEISSDKDKYEPGDKVTLNVKTTNAGKPIKSKVNISVVNEAVFMLQDEETTSLLQMIYSYQNYPGYTFSNYTDILEKNNFDGGGGGGGGGLRAKFGDTAYFETVETNRNGIATVTFTLPDNITTYRVTTFAVNKDLLLGENTKKLVSTLDFFIQHIEPRGVKTSDDLVLTATSIADKEFNVDFDFTIEELNKTLNVSETTNKMANVNFGKLEVGKYHAIIKGTNGQKTDSVKFEFEIVESTQEVKEKTTINVKETPNIKPTKNPITLEIFNKKMKQYIDYIDFIEKTKSSRLDTRIAYDEVQKIKSKYYNTEYDENYINMEEYRGNENRVKNLKNGSEDLLLTAFVKYYGGYNTYTGLKKEDNLFEYYLYLAANNEPVLQDLKYLTEAKETSNYNKLLLTLSFEFLGDYEDARNMYANIAFTANEKEEYSSIIAIVDTFINKSEVIDKINKLIETKPTDEYLRFAIISFFNNNSNEIEKKEKIEISCKTVNETIYINGLEVKKYTIYDSDLSEIKFNTESNDIMVSYYYQTSLEELNNNNISKDIAIKINGEIKKSNQVTLVLDFSKLKNQEGEIKISLPNNLRLAKDYNRNEEGYYKKYYLLTNKINYLTYYKQKECSEIKIPLMVALDGNYKFENIVFTTGDGIYHISNSLEIK